MKFWFFLQLIRWKNLVILATTLLIVKFGFINFFTEDFSLDTIRFTILLISILLITAAGYLINDIQDIEIDRINKPTKVYVDTVFSIQQSYNWYLILTTTGVLLGFYVANFLQKPIFSGLFIIVSYLLYFYSTNLKKLPLIGNIVIALLVSLSLITLAFFDLIIQSTIDNFAFHFLLFKLIFEFSILVFLLNLIREIVKDIEDIEGDKAMQLKTLPKFIGINNTKLLIGFLVLILGIILSIFMISYLKQHLLVFYFFLIAILLPLVYFGFKLYKATKKTDYTFLSNLLKFCMLSGIISIILISLSIKNVL